MAFATVLKAPGATLQQAVHFDGVAPIAVLSAVAELRGAMLGGVPLTVSAELADGLVTVELTGGSDGEAYTITVRAEGDLGAEADAGLDVLLIDPAWDMPNGVTPHLSIVEFVQRFGLPEVIAMTDATGDGRLDRPMLVNALIDAQSTVDVHIAGRYVELPPVVKRMVADLARASLYPRGAPDGVADQAKATMRMLERIQSGAWPLIGAETSEVPILIAPGRRAYPDGLAGY